MNTPIVKPIKKRVLNSKLLPIAAVVLIVLALLFMATPLLRQSRGFQRNGSFVLQNNGQTTPQNGFRVQSGGSQGQGLPGQYGSNFQNRQFAVRGNFLGGITGAIVFFVALLVSLVAGLGMFFTKRWGQVLGIIMAVLYGLMGLVSLLPILFIRVIGVGIPMSLILGFAHMLLALAVIVLASIPAKQEAVPVTAEPPPAAG
jgi:hypothetical protein